METVGTAEVKARLTQLLDRVSRGERFVITNRGKPVALLVPSEGGAAGGNVARIGQEMLNFRERAGRRLGCTFREATHEGHRF